MPAARSTRPALIRIANTTISKNGTARNESGGTPGIGAEPDPVLRNPAPDHTVRMGNP